MFVHTIFLVYDEKNANLILKTWGPNSNIGGVYETTPFEWTLEFEVFVFLNWASLTL